MRDFMLSVRSLILMASMVMVGLIDGCGLLSQQSIPDWVEGNSQHYPIRDYIVGRGEAESRELAEQRAYAAVARIFRANVKAQLQDSEMYSQLDSEEETTTNRELTLDYFTNVSTEKVLEDVQILESWRKPETGRFFSLAGLNRDKTERILLERISTYDRVIRMNMRDGHEGVDILTKIRGLKRALRTLQLRQAANADLRIVRVNGEGISSPYAIANIQRALDAYLLQDVRIDVRITGEQQTQIQQAVWDGLKQEGFMTLNQQRSTPIGTAPSTPRENYDLRIVGTTRLDDLNLFDPLFKYVRWCSTLHVIELNGHRVIGVVSRSGREGHVTRQEARGRAMRTMQEVVSTEIAKSLSRYIYDDDQIEVSSASSCLPPKSRPMP